MPQILYQKDNIENATMVFSDASKRGEHCFYGIVVGRQERNAPVRTYSGGISSATDNFGAEAAALREAVLHTHGEIILVTDQNLVAKFAANTLKGIYSAENHPHKPPHNQTAFNDLRTTLEGQKGRIAAVYLAPHEEYREQRLAHNLCRKIGYGATERDRQNKQNNANKSRD